MPESRTYSVTRVVVQEITANSEVDALRIAEATVPIKMTPPKPGSLVAHMDDDTYGWSNRPRIESIHIEAGRR